MRTTAALVHRHRLGDEDAFALLYDRHAEAIRRSVQLRMSRAVVSEVEVDDILQNTFVAVWQYVEDGRFAELQSVGAFRNLLVKIAVQKIKDAARHSARHKRSAHRTLRLADLVEDLVDGVPRPSQVMQAQEIELALERVLDQLSENDRWILDCRQNLGMTYQEIGDELGCSAPNAKLRCFRARQRLQLKIQRHFD